MEVANNDALAAPLDFGDDFWGNALAMFPDAVGSPIEELKDDMPVANNMPILPPKKKERKPKDDNKVITDIPSVDFGGVFHCVICDQGPIPLERDINNNVTSWGVRAAAYEPFNWRKVFCKACSLKSLRGHLTAAGSRLPEHSKSSGYLMNDASKEAKTFVRLARKKAQERHMERQLLTKQKLTDPALLAEFAAWKKTRAEEDLDESLSAESPEPVQQQLQKTINVFDLLMEERSLLEQSDDPLRPKAMKLMNSLLADCVVKDIVPPNWRADLDTTQRVAALFERVRQEDAAAKKLIEKAETRRVFTDKKARAFARNIISQHFEMSRKELYQAFKAEFVLSSKLDLETITEWRNTARTDLLTTLADEMFNTNSEPPTLETFLAKARTMYTPKLEKGGIKSIFKASQKAFLKKSTQKYSTATLSAFLQSYYKKHDQPKSGAVIADIMKRFPDAPGRSVIKKDLTAFVPKPVGLVEDIPLKTAVRRDASPERKQKTEKAPIPKAKKSRDASPVRVKKELEQEPEITPIRRALLRYMDTITDSKHAIALTAHCLPQWEAVRRRTYHNKYDSDPSLWCNDIRGMFDQPKVSASNQSIARNSLIPVKAFFDELIQRKSIPLGMSLKEFMEQPAPRVDFD